MNNLGLQRLGFKVETSPNAIFQVVREVKPSEWFSSGSNSYPDPFWRVGTVANTTRGTSERIPGGKFLSIAPKSMAALI